MDHALKLAKLPKPAKKLLDVPNIPDWMRQWGQAPGSDSHHGYKHTTPFGEYHISPAVDKAGKQVGFQLQFAHTGEGKKDKDHPGMWHDLGLHTHPGLAVAAARKHHMKFKAKNEAKVDNLSNNIAAKGYLRYQRRQGNRTFDGDMRELRQHFAHLGKMKGTNIPLLRKAHKVNHGAMLAFLRYQRKHQQVNGKGFFALSKNESVKKTYSVQNLPKGKLTSDGVHTQAHQVIRAQAGSHTLAKAVGSKEAAARMVKKLKARGFAKRSLKKYKSESESPAFKLKTEGEVKRRNKAIKNRILARNGRAFNPGMRRKVTGKILARMMRDGYDTSRIDGKDSDNLARIRRHAMSRYYSGDIHKASQMSNKVIDALVGTKVLKQAIRQRLNSGKKG